METKSLDLNGNGLALRNQFITNLFMMRSELLRCLDDTQDVNKSCHYPIDIKDTQYREMYEREGVAGRYNDIYPEECWKEPPLVYEKEQGAEAEFDKAFDKLCKRLNLWDFMERADKMSGVGTYSILFLGFDDANSPEQLQEPVPGVKEDGTYKLSTDTTGTGTTKKRRLLYLRAFDEKSAKISAWVSDPGSPRAGQPMFYDITFQDVKDGTSSLPDTQSMKVHWSRVVHFCDNRTTSEVIGGLRAKRVFNYLLNIRKILGAAGQGYWKGGFPGLSIETHPGNEDAELDIDKTRKMMADYFNELDRGLALEGATAKTLAPNTADPTPFFNVELDAICVTGAIPKRIFVGSERGELASSQDKTNWNDRLMRRNNRYLTPFACRPVIDRLIGVGCLPVPNAGVQSATDGENELMFMYEVEWPDLNAATQDELANRADKFVKAIVAYVAGDGASLISPVDLLTRFLGFEQDEAEAMLQQTADDIAATDDLLDPQAQVGRSSTLPTPADIQATERQPPPPAPGPGQGRFAPSLNQGE